jgi:osmotically inducible protein OsmC
MKIRVSADLAVNAEVDLCSTDGEYFLRARFLKPYPASSATLAQHLVEEAHRICPYSQATRGNVEVTITVA